MTKYGHLPLRDAYFAPERVEREGGIDPILRGAVTQVAQEVDLQVRQISFYLVDTFVHQI